MKAKEIYENALALSISHTDDVCCEHSAVRLLNAILAETFLVNNSLRKKNGKTKLTEMPEIDTINDDVCYEYELYAPLSYGLAALMLSKQGELTLSKLYSNQYITLLNVVTPCVESEVQEE